MNTQIFIEKSNKIWNNLYDYSLCNYINSNIKITIICKIHGEFQQLISNHYRYGCGKCRTPSKHNELLKKEAGENFIIKANLIHNNRYIYEKSIYITAPKKLIVSCSLHGDFEISPNNHLRGKGCAKCGRLISDKAKFKPLEHYIEEFKILFGDKYGDYSNINWKGGSKNITLICKKHGSFNILPYIHIKGKGCPVCSSNYSKISILWLQYLQIKYNIFIQHADNIGEYYIPNCKYKADGYCKETNTIYEFLGDFWHGNPNCKRYLPESINPRNNKTFKQLYEETQFKKEKILKLGYNYVEIWEGDWLFFIKKIKIIQKIWRKKLLILSLFSR
jgi:hypothetical protein